MKLNFELIKEDIIKIGVALIIATLVAAFLNNSSVFDIIYPFLWGVVLILSGSLTGDKQNE